MVLPVYRRVLSIGFYHWSRVPPAELCSCDRWITGITVLWYGNFHGPSPPTRPLPFAWISYFSHAHSLYLKNLRYGLCLADHLIPYIPYSLPTGDRTAGWPCSNPPSPSMVHDRGQTNGSEWIPLSARQGFVHTSNWRWGPEATLRNCGTRWWFQTCWWALTCSH